MADNTTLSAGSGGDTIRTEDRGSFKTPVSLLDKGAPGSSESIVTDANPFPITPRSSDGTELGTSSAPVRTDPTGSTTQPVSAAALPLPSGAATAAHQVTQNSALGAPADAEASGDGTLIALLKRLRTLLGGTLTVNGSGVTQPVSAAALPLPSGASTESTLSTLSSTAGGTADAAITTDTTGSLSGKLRGLVKWAFERMPASLGQKAKTASLPVVLASDQDALAVTLSGTLPAADAGSNYTTLRANISTADLTTAADLTAAPTSGQKIVIDDLEVSSDTAMRIDLIEETSGTVVRSIYISSYAPTPLTTRGKFKLPTADKKLRVQASTTGNLRVFCLYHSES